MSEIMSNLFSKIKKATVFVVIGACLLVMLPGIFTIVPEGHIGVKTQLGAIVASDLAAGPHFMAPIIQSVRSVDVREQAYEFSTTAYTKDTQTVENIRGKLNYQYDRSQLSGIIRNIGIENVESKLIAPQVNSILKNSIGGFKAEELVQNRSSLQEQVEDELRSSLAASGIVVISFNIENIDFEDSFEEVIRAKVAAEQEALRMQNETAAKEEQAKQTVIAAQAQADSQRIQAEAEAYAIQMIQEQLQASPEYIELQKVEKWNGEWPQVMGTTVNPFINMGGGN